MQHIDIQDAKGVPAIVTDSTHASNTTDASLVETLVAENGPVDEIDRANPMHILIVDDEPEITEELAEFLEDSGFSVSTATDPIDAIKMVKENEAISVVISDLGMPNMTGLEMIEEINLTFLAERDLAVIVVTGNANTDRAVKSLRLGATDFLLKPINPDILVHATKRAVESIRLKRLERDFRQQLERRVLERTEEVQKLCFLSSDLLAANDMLVIKNSELTAANQIKSEFLALKQGLVSVIITAYNRDLLLKESLESIYRQTYRDIEILLIDDFSFPPLEMVIASTISSSPFPISILRTDENLGAGAARETGRKNAHGDFIQYLDSDDLLAPNKLERQVQGLADNPDCDISYGRTIMFKNNPPKDINARGCDSYVRTLEHHDKMLPALLNGRLWATTTPLYRTSLINKVGPWLPLRICEDLEYEYRLGTYSRGLHYVTDTVAMVREHPARLVNNIQEIAGLEDHVTCYVSVLKNLEAQSVELDFKKNQKFSINIFFLARKAASLGRGEDMRILITGFLKINNLSWKRYFTAKIFSLFTRVLGAKQAGQISDVIETFK